MREKMFAWGKRRIRVIGQSANLNRIVAAITWIALVSSMFFMPVVALSSATYSSSVSTGMHKNEDIFGGSFSPPEVVAAPDEAFDVSFSICPTEDAPNTVIHFIMPSDVIKLVNGNGVWTGNVKKGEIVVLSLSFATNGDVDTYVRAGVEASDTGKKHQSSYYLHIATPDGGSNPEKGIPAREVTPDAKMRVELNIEPQPATPPLEPGPSQFGDIRIYGRWWYWNDEIGNWSAARYMLVEIWDEDFIGDDWLADGWTDGTGYFDITAPNEDDPLWIGRADPFIRFWARGEWDWFTTDSGGATYTWRYPTTGTIQDDVPDGWEYNTGDLRSADNYPAWQAGDTVYAEMQFVRNWVGWYRTPVNIVWPIEDWPHSNGDEIHLPATWGWDHVTVQHEQGHCVMWTLYGNSWPEGSEGGSHWIGMEDVLPDAWVEGYAEFMECAVDGNPNNLQGNGQNIETNDWYNWQDTGDMDGYCIEGEIASILWDIYDPLDTTDRDYMNWGFDEIFYVLQTQNPNDITDFWFDMIILWNDMDTCIGPLSTIFWHYGIDRDYYAPYDGYISINAGASYTKSRSVTLTLSCKDWGSGVTYMRFSNDLGATWSGWYVYSTTVSWTLNPGDEWKWVDVQFRDGVGYLTEALSIYDGIYLDTAPPTGSITINSGNPAYTGSTAVTLCLTYSDSLSDVAYVYYGNGGESWVGPFSPTATKAWTLPSGDGPKTVWYLIYDNAGNYYMVGDSIILDTTSPTGSIIINSGAAYTNSRWVTLTLSAGDSGSGVAYMRFADDWPTLTWSAWYPYATTFDFYIDNPTEGPIYIDVQFIDSVGNPTIAGGIYDVIILDTRPHDIAVVDVTTSRTSVGSGYPLLVYVTVENHGPFTASFNLTAYYGNSGITVEQWETFWSLGDVNRDGYINGTDQNLLSVAFGTTPESLNWNPWADLNQDLNVNMNDIAIFAYNYGLEIWTYAISGGVIETLPVIDLAPGNTQTLTFTWDTSSIPYDHYVICGYAVPILAREDDRADNTFVDGTVTVTIAGDTDADGDVDYDDFIVLAGAYGSSEGQPAYNPEANIDGDVDVDYDDFIILAGNYGKSITLP